MGKRRHRHRRQITWAAVTGAIIAVAAIVAVVFVATRPAPELPAAALTYTPKPIATTAAAPPVVVEPGTKAVLIGDSWAAGYGADEPETEGYAALLKQDLKLDLSVDAVSGSGYMNAGPDGDDTYLERITRAEKDETVKLVLIQGGGNDAGNKQPALRQRVGETIAAARATYPSAGIVLIGPAPLRFPLKGDIPEMTTSMAGAAVAHEAYLLSPYGATWFTAENAPELIDPEKLYHPTSEGHRHFADRVIEGLERLAALS